MVFRKLVFLYFREFLPIFRDELLVHGELFTLTKTNSADLDGVFSPSLFREGYPVFSMRLPKILGCRNLAYKQDLSSFMSHSDPQLLWMMILPAYTWFTVNIQ